MPTTTVEAKDLSSRFMELISFAAAGNEVIVTENNKPVGAGLVPLLSGLARTPDLHPGAVRMSDDFDAPLPDNFWTGEP